MELMKITSIWIKIEIMIIKQLYFVQNVIENHKTKNISKNVLHVLQGMNRKLNSNNYVKVNSMKLTGGLQNFGKKYQPLYCAVCDMTNHCGPDL